MATGDTSDIVSRLQRWLPTGWFPKDTGTRIYAVVSAIASLFVTLWNQLAYVGLQTRLTTATDGFVDLASGDFFGTRLARIVNESDAAFSLRIRKEVLRNRLTRDAIDALLFQLTGQHPQIVESERPADVASYRGFPMRVGFCGSRAWRFSVFITTIHAGAFGIPNVAGWRGYLAGLRTGSFVWAGPWMLSGAGLTDTQMFAALDSIRAAGVTFWVRFSN